MFRFIHSSDLHLGKRFAGFPEDVRGRLREARHTVIERLAQQALSNQATAILLAGDTFDTETPAPDILRQALAAMAHHDALTWIILPGNHDALAAEELWSSAKRDCPANIRLALDEGTPIAIGTGVSILPAPCSERRPGRDLTEWMNDAATPEGDIRIGLAHGAVLNFSEEDTAADIIAPDRAGKAGLDYLALGDWHGQIRVNERTWYSGSPEPDRFKHRIPGKALLVTIDGPGASPDIQPIVTGSFLWQTVDLELFGQDDAVDTMLRSLPEARHRRQTLLRLMVSGRTTIESRIALSSAFERLAPEFAHAVLDPGNLETLCESTDLDLIDQAGSLRKAAETLLEESSDPDRALSEREIARDALIRLFSYCEGMRQP